MTNDTFNASDEMVFLRRRGMTLWDEGFFTQARSLFAMIDEKQRMRIEEDLEKMDALEFPIKNC